VVGGGLTAVQLCLGAVERGARPVLLSRAPLRERDFDVRPGWFTYRLERYQAQPAWDRRAETLRAERRGSVPAAELDDLATCEARAELDSRCGVALREVSWSGTSLDVDGVGADRLWLATGHGYHVAAEPLLDELCRTHPVRVVAGLPVLTGDCLWPGTAVHVMGGLAALQLGPIARNLAGARIAAERIAAAAGRRAPLQYPAPQPTATPTPAPAR
ncbi:MAG TPA: hypothetical protein VGL20_12530, partial [Candidatus Dormibacteraeota bacterium]